MTPLVQYNLYRISEIVPTDFESKLIVALTFNTGSVLFQDEWFPFNIQYKLKLNNLAFGFSSKEYNDSEKLLKKHKPEWEKCTKKLKKFFDKIFQMNAQSTKQYTQIFEQHNAVMENIAEYRVTLENIEKIRNYLDNGGNSQLQITKWIATSYHNTVCSEHSVVCHEDCALNFNGISGTEFFNNCACMGVNKTCRKCGCLSEQHVHKHEKPVTEVQAITELLRDCAINGDTSDPAKLKKALENREIDIIKELGSCESKISKVCPKYKLSKYFVVAVEHVRTHMNANADDPVKFSELAKTLDLYSRLMNHMK